MLSQLIPLHLRERSAEIAIYNGDLVRVDQFVNAAGQLKGKLEVGCEWVNLCQNRFHFLVSFCAIALSGGKNILPPNKLLSTLKNLRVNNPRVKFIVDAECELPELDESDVLHIESLALSGRVEISEPLAIPADQCVAEVYTSGSTGQPQRISKTWKALSLAAVKIANRFDEPAKKERAKCLVSTVPCQHMYGIENTVVMPLFANYCMHDTTFFYPEDIAQQIDACHSEVRLVSTPAHLRAYHATGSAFSSKLTQIISATAPLDLDLVKNIERHSKAELFEIFGFSEAGSIASRRTSKGPVWHLLEGIRLAQVGSVVTLHGDHLDQPEIIQDEIALIDSQHFEFIARPKDQINIGGKRMSLYDLMAKLLAIDFVEDAFLYVPKNTNRPAGFLVSSLSARDVLKQLAGYVDPVFLPRPLTKVEKILRNATGKVTQHEIALMSLSYRSEPSGVETS